VEQQRSSDASRPDETPGSMALQLSPKRAFGLHLDARAQPPRRMGGRIEPVTAGPLARSSSLREFADLSPGRPRRCGGIVSAIVNRFTACSGPHPR